MNFRCSELQGAIHQPKELLEIANCWIIPACKGGPVLGMPDLKLIFVYNEDMAIGKGSLIGKESLVEYLFVHCYQFLFCVYSYVYWFYSLRQLNRSESFVLSGADISDIEKQIRKKYNQQDDALSKDFTNIESAYCTHLPNPVNFEMFYKKFAELYENNDEFKGIITLFCETNNGVRILYYNDFQKIAQLQIIVDALLGQPKQSYCKNCGSNKNNETWNVFLERCLKKYGITDPDYIRLITKIRMTLNDARVKFIHHAKYYNPNDPSNIVADFQTGEKFDDNLDINQILEKNPDSWRGIDLINVYTVYQVCVRNLIYSKYFLS